MNVRAIYAVRLMLLLLVFYFCPHHASSQTLRADSLKKLLPLKNGVEKIDLLYEIGYELVDTDDRLALSFSSEALKHAREKGDTLRIVKTGRVKALAFRRLEKLDSSLALSLEIIPMARRHGFLSELKTLSNGIGLMYIYQAKYDLALTFLFESLEYRERDGNGAELAVVLNNIGLVYFHLSNFEKAIQYYRRSVSADKKDNSDSHATAYSNIGLCHAYQNAFDSAIYNIDKGFAVCKEKCSNGFLMNANYGLGMAWYGTGDVKKAENYFLKSYEYAKQFSSTRVLLDNLAYLLQISIDNNQLEKAERYLRAAESLVDPGTEYTVALANMYELIIAMYTKLKNINKVAIYQARYIEVADATYNDQLVTNLMRVEAAHLEKDNKAKIEAQAKVLILNQEVLKRQSQLNVVIGLVVFLLITLTVVLIRNNRQIQRVNHLLDMKVKERTEELAINHDALLKAAQERDVLAEKAASDIRSSVATIKGLCLLGSRDITGAPGYFDKVRVVSDGFSDVVKKLASKKT